MRTCLVATLLLACAPLHAQAPLSSPAPPPFDKAIFARPLPADQVAFLRQIAHDASASGSITSGDLLQDKTFRKVLKNVLPDGTFHYGSDKPLSAALDEVFDRSTEPVTVREGRYLVLSGHSGRYLAGRAMLWFDTEEGVGLGAFFFHPTNGEPTPALNVFSREIRDPAIALSELPPTFAEDLATWAAATSVPALTTRYFISGNNKKLLLAHDEDFCKPVTAAQAIPGDCQQANADAADLDVTAASYLEATHYATNATAWMISGEDRAFLTTRAGTCGIDYACRIRLDRARIAVLTRVPMRRH